MITTGIVYAPNAEVDRRNIYALSEKGEVLRVNNANGTYGIVRDRDGGTVLSDGQTLTTIKNRAKTVDPNIP